jgi:hypothetical protein
MGRRDGPTVLAALAALVVLGAVLTGGGVAHAKPKPPATKPAGPIVAMAVASSVDSAGRLVHPTFTFAPSDPTVTVVVLVGQLKAPGRLTVTWYQSTDKGDHKLFVQHIPVQSFDRATAVGQSQGGLATGNHKVTASRRGLHPTHNRAA